MSSVTTNADMQIVEVAPLLRLRTERCYQVRLIADEAKCAWFKMADGTFAAADARKSVGFRSMAGKLLLSSYGTLPTHFQMSALPSKADITENGDHVC